MFKICICVNVLELLYHVYALCKQVLVSCVLIKVDLIIFYPAFYQNIINNHTVNSLCYWYLNICLIAYSMEHGPS